MKKYIALFILIFSESYQTFGQTSIQIIDDLNTIIKPITNINPEDNFKDIDFLRNVIKDSTIIGIGESTHGTPLYDIYRQRLIRFLVQEMGYKSIIDEGDIFAAEKIDDYINGTSDTAEFLGGLGPVLTSVKELNWFKEYNSNKSENQRVHIYGAEVRGFFGIIQKIKTLFPNISNGILQKFEGDIGVGYKKLTKKDFEDISIFSLNMKKKSSNSKQDYYLALLNQQIDFAYRQRFGKSDFNIRDQYMFENIKLIISNTIENKVIILAHNGHLQKTKFQNLTSLGYLLNNYYSGKYFVAATDFNIGNVYAYNLKSEAYENKFFSEVQDKNTVEYILAQCKYSNFFLSVNDATKIAAANSFVNSKLKVLRSIGSTGDITNTVVRIFDNYDLVIFFNNTDMQKINK